MLTLLQRASELKRTSHQVHVGPLAMAVSEGVVQHERSERVRKLEEELAD